MRSGQKRLSHEEDSSPRGWDEFAPLYDEHHARLYRIALLLCNGSTAVAEDAVADTFIRVYKAWANGGVEHFFAYARQTLVNRVTGQFRSDQVATRYASTWSGEGRGEQPFEQAVVDTDTTFALLAQLAPQQRTAVVLRYYEDLSYEQIAATMDLSVGTAKSHVSVGLQRLRSLAGDT